MSAAGYSNPCPTCGEPPFQQCRSLTRGKTTDTHVSRLEGNWPSWCDQHQQWLPKCELHGKTHVIANPKETS